MLDRIVTDAAARWTDRTAFVAATGWSLSYSDLDRLSDEVACGLARRGIGIGSVVALVLPPTPTHVVLFAAAAKIGAITAGVNHRLGGRERQAVLAATEPDLIVTMAPSAPAPTPTFDSDLGADEVVLDAECDASAGAVRSLEAMRCVAATPPPLEPDPDRPVAIVGTSGTTGLPKGAVFAGRQLSFITATDTGGQWGPGGATIAGTSLSHLGPTTKLAGNLVKGLTTHVMSRWRADAALDLVERHRVAGIGGIPTQIALMLRDPDLTSRDLSSLRAIVIGGGPATPALVRAARSTFGAALSVRYSCTEAGIGVGTAFDDDPIDAEVSVGRPHHGVEVVLVDTDLQPVEEGDVGEVCLRSPAVMSEYWRRPDLTAEAILADGSVRTGDLGRMDDRGRLRLVGRRREMYVRGGYNVFPAEVEAVLHDHPGVAEVAVGPRPDDVMGEIGVAVVVPRDPADPPTLESLRRHARDRLAHHKQPEALRIVDHLPLTPMDKVDRTAVTRLATTPGPAPE